MALARERQWRHVELRHIRQQFAEWPVKRHKVAMSLALPADPDALWSSFDRKVRNQVRKAEKSGCSAEDGGAELLDDFYKVFAHNMRDLGTPVYARRFFADVLHAFPNDTRVFVVRIAGEPVAASITIGWRDTPRGAVGVVASRARGQVAEHAAVLGDAAMGDAARLSHVRLRPIDA